MKIALIRHNRKGWQVYGDFLQVPSQAAQIILLKLTEKSK